MRNKLMSWSRDFTSSTTYETLQSIDIDGISPYRAAPRARGRPAPPARPLLAREERPCAPAPDLELGSSWQRPSPAARYPASPSLPRRHAISRNLPACSRSTIRNRPSRSTGRPAARAMPSSTSNSPRGGSFCSSVAASITTVKSRTSSHNAASTGRPASVESRPLAAGWRSIPSTRPK
jgi:hypothetical protein